MHLSLLGYAVIAPKPKAHKKVIAKLFDAFGLFLKVCLDKICEVSWLNSIRPRHGLWLFRKV